MSDGPDEIYDTVPEDLKNEMAGDEEEGIFEDIYDIPPGQFEKERERKRERKMIGGGRVLFSVAMLNMCTTSSVYYCSLYLDNFLFPI